MEYRHQKKFEKVVDGNTVFYVDYVKYDVPADELALDIMKVKTSVGILFMRNATKILINTIDPDLMERIETKLYELND